MKKVARERARMITNFHGLSERDDIDPNVHMFREDVRLGIMPIGGRAENHPSFSVVFEGQKKDCEKAMELCSSIAKYECYDAVSLICDMIDNIALYLSWFGRAVYEIICDEDNLQKCHLHGFTIKRLYRMPYYYIQWIPSVEYKRIKKRFIIVPSKDIWEISIPSMLGGAEDYYKILSKLRRVSHLGPKFWRLDLAAQRQTTNFNFQEYVRHSEMHYARVTRRWGWGRRDYSQRNNTEFFIFYQMITFKWAKAVLREHIISEINRLFLRLQLNSKIVVSGLPAPQDILDVRNKLIEGTIQFSAALDQVSI